MLLSGQVAVVTGGASEHGIGRATACLFAQYGAYVAVLDIDGQGAQQAGDSLGSEHRGYHCDVTKGSEVQTVFSQVASDLGSPSILVNNAGITQPKRIAEITEADYDKVLDVNLKGTFLCSKAVLPYMRRLGSGSIICMSSVSAKRGGGIFGGPHYSAAKAGILGLARAMARELAPEGHHQGENESRARGRYCKLHSNGEDRPTNRRRTRMPVFCQSTIRVRYRRGNGRERRHAHRLIGLYTEAQRPLRTHYFSMSRRPSGQTKSISSLCSPCLCGESNQKLSLPPLESKMIMITIYLKFGTREKGGVRYDKDVTVSTQQTKLSVFNSRVRLV
jgi:NADP-dependent 3-hydroxy acid dehydrogenase YdfG